MREKRLLSNRRSSNLTLLARLLRRNQTNAERALWYNLRGRRFSGYKFKRQFALSPYIADFCCEAVKLIIELDGGQHGESSGEDAVRTGFFESRGYRVLRFWNNDMFTNTDGVLEVILNELEARTRSGGC